MREKGYCLTREVVCITYVNSNLHVSGCTWWLILVLPNFDRLGIYGTGLVQTKDLSGILRLEE